MPRPYLQIESGGRVPVRITLNLQGNGRFYDVLHPSSPVNPDGEWDWNNLSGPTKLTEVELLEKITTALRGLPSHPDPRTPIFKISI